MRDWNAFFAGAFVGVLVTVFVAILLFGISAAAEYRECSKWNNGAKCEYVLQPETERK